MRATQEAPIPVSEAAARELLVQSMHEYFMGPDAGSYQDFLVPPAASAAPKVETPQEVIPETAPEVAPEEVSQQDIEEVVNGFETLLQKEAPKQLREHSPRWKRLRRGLGTAAMAGVVSVLSFGVASAISGTIEDSSSTLRATGVPAPAVAPVPPTTVSVPETPPSTTVPEKPVVPFEVPANSVIGSITIPKICENIQMWEYDQSETALVGTTINDAQERVLANGAVKLDTLTPDPQRAADCEGVDNYAATHPGYMGRTSWRAMTAISPDNPAGNVNYYRPIVGHENADGKPTTVYPGQVGISVFYGHRSTYSAPTKDIEVLEPNDAATVKRADGKAFAYRFTERLSINPDNAYNELLDYYHTKVAQAKAAGQSPDIRMMVIGGCGDDSGQPGGDATRVFAVFVV